MEQLIDHTAINKIPNALANDLDNLKPAIVEPTLPSKNNEPEVKLRKSKKKKPKRRKGKRNPTGFEEFVVDGPLTVEETKTEELLYSPTKPFCERIETCIQRYKARRKWDQKRLRIFNLYLRVGGVASGPKQFSGGLDAKKVDMDAEAIAQLAATDFVMQADSNDNDGLEWGVDFCYVVRGFLSHKVPYTLGYRTAQDIELSCRVITNFLNYVLYHNVAPEYYENIKDAMEICERGEKELMLCAHVSNCLPGNFNKACSTIFGGVFEGIYSGPEITWVQNESLEETDFSEFEAKEIVLVALSKRGADKQQRIGLNRKVIQRNFMSLEVTDVIIPERERNVVEDEDKDLPQNKHFRDMHTLGLLKLKPWIPEDPLDNTAPVIPDNEQGKLEVWLEKSILQYCFVGMHLETRVHTFEDGLVFIDSVIGVFTSFYLRLEAPSATKDSDDEFD